MWNGGMGQCGVDNIAEAMWMCGVVGNVLSTNVPWATW
jgi:hypothetical protein